jgi:hypothetical protein
VVILTGDEKEAVAKDKLAAFLKEPNTLVTFSPGYPKIIKSDDMAGLNPGFFIAIGGVCKDAKAARAASALLGLASPGTYLRKVKADEDTCPKVKWGESRLPRGYQLQEHLPLDADHPALELAIYAKDSGTRGCESRNVLVRVELGNAVVAQDEWPAECNAPSGGDDLGSQKGYSATIDDKDGRSVITLQTTTWGGDTPDTSNSTVTFSLAGLHETTSRP